jgi:hypothetical protein
MGCRQRKLIYRGIFRFRHQASTIGFRDQCGKRRLETLPAGTTKKKANARLREIEQSVGKGVFLPVKKVPFFKEVWSMGSDQVNYWKC